MLVLIVEALILIVCTFIAINYLSAKFLWLVVAILLLDVLLGVKIFAKLKKRSKRNLHKDNTTADLSLTIAHVDETFCMSGHEFEVYIATLYSLLGYKIIDTKKSCDQGIDIIAKRFFKIGIQAKCYSRPVGNKAVQEAAAGKRFYNLHKTIVVTNGIFTDSAKALAKKNKVLLIDKKQLAAMVKKANSLHKK